jgi:membrane protein
MPAFDHVKRVYAKAQRDDIFNGAAALGFYLTLAIFPIMIFLMALVPYLPIADVGEAMMGFLRQVLPPSAMSMFADVLREVTRERRGGLLSFGIVAALWSASTGMYAVMQQLNDVYEVEEKRPFLRARATAVGLTILFGVLVLGAFSLVVLGGVMERYLGDHFGVSQGLLLFFRVFRWVVIVLALLLAISLVYYLGPNRHHPFKFLSRGSVLAAVLLIAASFGFSLYTSNFNNYSAVYGSIGAVIILMMWLYIVGLVILLGAEINASLERDRLNLPAFDASPDREPA